MSDSYEGFMAGTPMGLGQMLGNQYYDENGRASATPSQYANPNTAANPYASYGTYFNSLINQGILSKPGALGDQGLWDGTDGNYYRQGANSSIMRIPKSNIGADGKDITGSTSYFLDPETGAQTSTGQANYNKTDPGEMLSLAAIAAMTGGAAYTGLAGGGALAGAGASAPEMGTLASGVTVGGPMSVGMPVGTALPSLGAAAGGAGGLGSILSALGAGGKAVGGIGSVLGALGGTGGSAGGGLGGLGSLIPLLGGAASAYNQGQASDKMLSWLNGQQAKIDNLYKPNTPEYNQLWEEMSRKDAAAGRNSQYGPRSVDLAAKIAQTKADATAKLTQGIAGNYSTAINQDANKYAGLFGALGANNTMGGMGGLAGLLNSLTGGSGNIPTSSLSGISSWDNAWTSANGGSTPGFIDYGEFF